MVTPRAADEVTAGGALVALIMGSRSDWETMRDASDVLRTFGVAHESRVISAHRTPGLLSEYGVDSYTETARPVDANEINRVTANGTRPAIYMIKSEYGDWGHIVVVDGVDEKGNVKIRDPGKVGEAGCRVMDTASFNKTLYPESSVVIVGSPPPGYQPAMTTKPRAAQ